MCKQAASLDTQTTLTILQLNDVYQISPVDKGQRGGMARVATLQKQIRAAQSRLSQADSTVACKGSFAMRSVLARARIACQSEPTVVQLRCTGFGALYALWKVTAARMAPVTA